MTFDPSRSVVACPFCQLPTRVIGSSQSSYRCDNGHMSGVVGNGKLTTSSGVYVMSPAGINFAVPTTAAVADREKIVG